MRFVWQTDGKTNFQLQGFKSGLTPSTHKDLEMLPCQYAHELRNDVQRVDKEFHGIKYYILEMIHDASTIAK